MLLAEPNLKSAVKLRIMPPNTTWRWIVVLFSVAFDYVEAAVVAYHLRAIYSPAQVAGQGIS